MAYSAEDFIFQLPSVVRGHHIYKSVWIPSIGETLALQVDAEDEHGAYSGGIVKDSVVVARRCRTCPLDINIL